MRRKDGNHKKIIPVFFISLSCLHNVRVHREKFSELRGVAVCVVCLRKDAVAVPRAVQGRHKELNHFPRSSPGC